METHISAPVRWSEAVFVGFEVTEEVVIIFLLDGTQRKMKRDWGPATTTLKKVERLSYLDKISYATWSTYDSLEWFCDVRLSILQD